MLDMIGIRDLPFIGNKLPKNNKPLIKFNLPRGLKDITKADITFDRKVDLNVKIPQQSYNDIIIGGIIPINKLPDENHYKYECIIDYYKEREDNG